MKKVKLPDKWRGSEQSVRAIQVAFELGGGIPDFIRVEAVKNGLSASNQIRKIIGLETKITQRPRLTVSLLAQDYAILAQRYQLSESDHEGIRECMKNELVRYHKKHRNKNAK